MGRQRHSPRPKNWGIMPNPRSRLLDHYNKDLYGFEFKSTGARNNALERNDLDYDLVEDLKGYVVKLPKFAKYAQILKNSVATKETTTERLFLMKDLAAVEEAVGLGAKIVEGMWSSEVTQSLTPSASGWPRLSGLTPGSSPPRNVL